jgi:hypothetical protein
MNPKKTALAKELYQSNLFRGFTLSKRMDALTYLGSTKGLSKRAEYQATTLLPP